MNLSTMKDSPVELCQFCKRLNISSLVPDEEGNCFQHHPTYYSLELSAQECALCSIIFTAFEARNTNIIVPPDRPSKADYARTERSNIWILSSTYSIASLTRSSSGGGLGISGARVNVGTGGYLVEIDLTISTSPDDTLYLNGDIVSHGGISEPGSVESIVWVRNMFDSCERDHSRCSQLLTRPGDSRDLISVNKMPLGEFPMPTRLIDVEEMRLWETQRQTGRYAALSYCWGRDRSVRFKTSDETYDERLKGFRESDVPKTIRDAIRLSRQLGLKYLWVDALCIIQGNKADWAIESARMNEVYANATITIAAAAARESKEGLFKKRDFTSRPSISLPSKCSKGTGSGIMHISQKTGTVYEVLERSPLCERGWTLQERVLSRRTIHFAQDQMYWECQERSLSEDGLDFRDSMTITDFFSKSEDMARPEPFTSIRKNWELLVVEYSNRILHDPFDKLPAFSGLAKEAQNRTGMDANEYYAGLWKTDLPGALLWAAKPGAVRPKEWRAPSWSWASLDGLVSFAFKLDFPAIEKLEILNVVSEPEDVGNVLGAVKKGGKMTVRARIFSARRASTRVGFDPSFNVAIPDLHDAVARSGSFDLDCNDGSLDFPCLLVRCAWVTKANLAAGILTWYFLGLEQVYPSSIKTFRRIGVGSIRAKGQGFLESHPREDIVLE